MAVRKHPISGEPILYAPNRAGRPNVFERSDEQICPFCPGNESLTPPEIARIGDPWRVRVFPNKYPAVEGHEVIVESNRHDATFESIENAADVMSMYISRYRAHAGAASVSLFTNSGERAGASIDHIHSQLMPVPFIPPRIEQQLAAFASGPCPLCRSVGTVIEENDSFRLVVPDAAQQAYQQWIVPKRHEADFTSLHDAEVVSLAAVLQNAVRAAHKVASSHNVLFMNFPRHTTAHFYIDIFPRMTPVAGFELATGTFIDIIDPAAASRRLR
jgi:UDPglucose--hexose-1-phosphate uridylyltransferase